MEGRRSKDGWKGEDEKTNERKKMQGRMNERDKMEGYMEGRRWKDE